MSQRILVVDDDESILDAVSLILADEGYTVKAIPDGEEAQKAVLEFNPQAIILDLLMSGSDGRDICKKLKSDPSTKNIPIIMTSAHPTAKNEAIEAGADDFLAKPFDTRDLLGVVSKALH